MNFVHLNGAVETVGKTSNHGILGYDSCLKVRMDHNFLDINGDNDSFLVDVYLWKGAKKDIISEIETSNKVIVHGRLDIIASELVVIAEQIKVI